MDNLKKYIYYNNKSILRKVYLEKRKTLTNAEFISRNKNILSFILKEFDFSISKFVHVFLPIEKFREVNTLPLIDYLKSKNQQIVLSKSKLKTNDMQHFLLNDNTELIENKWGIIEPKGGIEISKNKLDIVFVPLLVFDKKGNRIGYGKGYYDKFLSKCNNKCIKIGLSLSSPLDLIPCMNSLDIPLDYCICHLEIYKFLNI